MKKLIMPQQLAGIIDHTYLHTEQEGHSPGEQKKRVEQAVMAAHQKSAFAVCVRETQVALAKKLLIQMGSPVQVVSVIGFPRGDDYSTRNKIEFFQKALSDGASEFDMVFNYEAFLKNHYDQAFQDVAEVSQAVGKSVLKVIFENTALGSPQIKEAAYSLVRKAFEQSGTLGTCPRFFKTSTGFFQHPSGGGTVGATLDDVRLMKRIAASDIGIKPSGGISSYSQALDYLALVKDSFDEERGFINPYKFRIGSSSLLLNLEGHEKERNSKAY